MKKLGLLTLAGLALTLGTVSQGALNAVPQEVHDANIIVELKADTRDLTHEQVLHVQSQIFQEIRETITPSFEVEDRYFNIFNGFSLRVNQSHVDAIRHLDGVKLINYNKAHAKKTADEVLVFTKEGEKAKAENDLSNISAATMEKPEGTNEGEGTFVAILDTSFLLTHEAFEELDETKVKVKVTQDSLKPIINATSFHGKPGVGEDKTTYWNNKVPFYYDYGGEIHSVEQEGDSNEDWDVYSDLSPHGTHVASIVGANGPYEGIAPNCQLALMKVFTDIYPSPAEAEEGYTASTGCFNTALLNALEDASALQVDVINMSLGTDLDDFHDDSIVVNVLNRLKSEGVFCSIAAGNAGKDTFSKTGAYANWTTDMQETGIMSEYGNDDSSMLIGAAQPDRQYYETALLINGRNIAYQDQVENYNSKDGEVKFDKEIHLADITNGGQITEFQWQKIPGYGKILDYDEVPDVTGKIVVVDRGENTFTQKVENAESKGAIAIAVINNDPSENDFTFRMDFAGYSPKIPVITVLFRDRDVFLTSNAKPLNIIINQVAENPTARTMADFSSDSPTHDLTLKPDISAPGLNIKGAVFDTNNSYDYLSGTSMATPNFAGSVALMLGEHPGDEAFRKSLNLRAMSTALVMKDINAKYPASVRQQGAGMLDIAKTLNSTVYLEGVNEENQGIGKAKIQLRNNEAIKNGNVKLSFLVHNTTDHAVTYTASTSIYRPDTVTMDPERFPEFKDVKLQTTYNTVVAENIKQQITVEPGTHLVELDNYKLPTNVQDEIDSLFEYGCYLEGFVTLTTEDKTANNANIPFMGYYGDYFAQAPVEPFKHERDNSKTYPSDLLNDLAHNGLALDSADFASGMVQGYWPTLSNIDITPMLLNKTNLWNLKDSNNSEVVSVSTNPYTGEVDSATDIYLGNNGIANTIILQQYVTRSVESNYIKVTNKATGDLTYYSACVDSLWPGSEDQYSLCKSHALPNFLENGILAHRAYGVITTYDPNTLEAFPDGEYELKFEYNVVAGFKYEKVYTLHIDSSAPEVEDVEHIKVNDVDTVRVRYNEDNLSYVTINGRRFQVSKDDKGYYVDLKKSDYEKKNKVHIKSYDHSYGSSSMMFYLNDENGVIIENPNILYAYDFETKVTDNGNNPKDKTIEFLFSKRKAPVEVDGTSIIRFNLFEGFNPNKTKIYSIDESGRESMLLAAFNGNQVKVTSPTLKLRVVQTSGLPQDPTSQATTFAQDFLDLTSKNCSQLVVQDEKTWNALTAEWNDLSNEGKDIFRNSTDIKVINDARERYNFIINKYSELNPFIDGIEKAPIAVTTDDNKGELINILLITGSVFAAAGMALIIVLNKKSKKKTSK